MAEEKTARRLFVGGLYDGITQKDLSDRFSRFGEVSGVDIRARKDNLGTILKTFAYLNMSISEKDYKKCMVTFNKTTWRGNEMQIQLAKESFMDRLAREREAAKIQETCPPVKPVLEPVTLQVKGAPPGTAVEGKQDWVVGKYGRALPVVNIRTKNKKKVLTIDPSKYVHGVKKFDHGKKAEAMEETDPSPSVNGLTWHLEVEETETLKKIKGEFPKSKNTPQKRKHSPRDDSINTTSPGANGNRESRSMKAYHSNSDSGSSDEEKTQISKKKKSAPKSPDVSEKTSTVVQTPQTPLVNGKRKRTLSDTSSPYDRKDTRSRAISPNVSIIEPQVNGTPTKVQKPSALDILTRLKLSSQKKVLDVKKCVFDDEVSKVTSSKSAADNAVSKNVQLGDKSPMNNKSPATTKRKSLSSSISETTSWSPSIDVGAAEQAATPSTPKAADILEKLKLASQRKQNVETTPTSRKRDTSESIDVGTDKQSFKAKTPTATDILEKLKRKQNVDTTPTSRKSAESIDVGTDKQSVKPKTPNATDILEKLKRKQNVDTTPTSKKCTESIDVGTAKQSAKSKTPNATDIMEKLKRKQNLNKTPTSSKCATSETSSVDVLPPKEIVQKENKKSTVQPKSQKEDLSSSDSEDEVKVRQSNKKSKSPKVPAVLTMETETQEQVAQKSKKTKSQKNTPTANMAIVIKFDDDIGVDTDDEEDVNSRRPIPRQPVPRRNAMLVQPAFAQVGSVDEFGVGVLVDENTRPLSEQEKKWKRYNSHTYSSDEDILDAAKAGSFTKLERIAKLAQLGQKHIEISTELRANNQLAPKVYNSDSNSDDDGFKHVQAAPKRTQEKSIQPKVKNTQKRKQQIQNAKSSDSEGTSSEDDVEPPVQQKKITKNNSSTTKKKLLVASKEPESSDESSTSASDSEEVVTLKTSTAKSSTNSSESFTEEVEPVKNKSNPPKQKESESSSDSSESEAEEATKKTPVQKVKASENVPNGKEKAQVNKKLRVDASESSSESSTSSEEEAKEVKQKPQSREDNSPVNKKKTQKDDSPKSSSESSTSSSDEEAVEVKQKPQVLIKKANPAVNKKEVQQEENSTSSSESGTSSDEEVEQVKPKPQVVQSKKNNTPVSKKDTPKEESSSESSTSSDEEPTKSKPAAVKQKISEKSKSTTPVSQAVVKAKAAEVPKAKAEKPKLKSKEAVNQLRLESLKLRNQEALAQKNLLKKALASVDANSSNSNKIRFDSESEDEKMKMQDDSSLSDSDSGDSGNDSDDESSDEEPQPKPNKDPSTKKPALFDEDSDESEDDTEDQFRVRPQFEGEAGSKLIALQSRFGNDPRFKFTEKFLEKDNEETAQDSNAEEEMEVTEDSTVTERDRTLAILKGVVGQGDGKKKTKAVLFKDMATQQYDPTKDEHKQFEVQVEKKEKKKKKKEVQVGPEAEALPQVSGDRYFEVQNSLKNMFNKTDDKPFSLLAMLGRTEDEPVAKGFSQQADGMGQVFQHVKNPWQQQFGSDGESSGDEHDDNTSAQPTEADNGTKHQRGSIQSRGSHGFFFVDNDPRIRDGIDFFRRQGDIEHIREKWAQERPDLVEAYRNKRKRFRFMKKEGTTPNYKSNFKPRGGRGGGGRGRR